MYGTVRFTVHLGFNVVLVLFRSKRLYLLILVGDFVLNSLLITDGFLFFSCVYQNEEEIAASEECQKVFSRLQEKGIDISMETLKRLIRW